MNDLVIVVSNFEKTISPIDEIEAIKEAGFNQTFIQWYNRPWKISQEEQLSYMKKIGLKVEYAHLGYDNINDLWLSNGDYLVTRYKHDIKICCENNIKLVMMHITGKKTPKYNEMGLERIKKIVAYAASLGIKVALENVEDPGYLEYVLTNIKDANLGICFDSGHYHCYFHDKFDFSLFKDRILAVHLHDNYGKKDEHLLPFEGTNDWPFLLTQLKLCNYQGPIILEVIYQKEYLRENIVSFYQKAFKIGQKLKIIYETI